MENREMTGQKGQALLFVTLSVLVIFGMMALVVDLGYAYYKTESAQSAADAAAMAAAVYALNNGHTCGQNGVVCGTTYNCVNPSVATSTTDLQMGCLYAAANGFQNAGNQTAWLIADYTVPPGGKLNSAVYWSRPMWARACRGSFISHGCQPI